MFENFNGMSEEAKGRFFNEMDRRATIGREIELWAESPKALRQRVRRTFQQSPRHPAYYTYVDWQGLHVLAVVDFVHEDEERQNHSCATFREIAIVNPCCRVAARLTRAK